MLDVFFAQLEARDPAKGHFRSYRLEVEIDLLGDWLVHVIYGRIGTRGHRIRHVVAGPAEAQRLIKQALRRRSTAQRRIGTGYRLLALHDPQGWFSLELASPLTTIVPAWRSAAPVGFGGSKHGTAAVNSQSLLAS